MAADLGLVLVVYGHKLPGGENGPVRRFYAVPRIHLIDKGLDLS